MTIILLGFGLIGALFVIAAFYMFATMAMAGFQLYLYSRNHRKINWKMYDDYNSYKSRWAIWLPKHRRQMEGPYYNTKKGEKKNCIFSDK